MPVAINLQIIPAAAQITKRGEAAIVNAAGDVLRESTPRTPYRKGELRSKRRVVPINKGARIEWQAGHAAVQNAGRRAGARPFSNYTTAGTGKEFVQLGLNKVLPKILRYFK